MFENLPDDWDVVKAGELADPGKYSCVGGPFGSNLVRQDYVEHPGVPVIRGGNLILGSRIFQDLDFVFVSEEKAASLQQNTAYPGDLVFMQRGASIGQVSLIPRGAKFSRYVLSQNLMKLTPDPEKADVDFLCYYFLSPLAQELIQRHSVGSTIPGFNLTQLRDFPVPLPPLDEQEEIAHILGTLDDKIELNQQMNQTLEGIARALFKSWFIDFDPVRAKMDGRQPAGMDAETATLFPDKFEDSALGKIPKGWRLGSVGEEFDITMGQSPPGETYNEEGNGLPFYQGRRDFSFRYPSVRIYCNAPSRIAQPGDTLVSVRAPVGDINMTKQECCIGRGVASVRHKKRYRSYTFYFMHSLDEQFANFEAEGTVFGSINKQDFLSISCLIPPLAVVEKFEQFSFWLDQTIENNEEQSQNLISVRDSILPRLLSGRLRVK